MKARRWGRWTLRWRLVAAVAGLTGLALLTSAVAGPLLLRAYLLARVDDQLRATAEVAVSLPLRDIDSEARRELVRRLPERLRLEDRRIYGYRPGAGLYEVTVSGTDGGGHEPDLGPPERLPDRSGRPYTVDSRDGEGSWRVLVTPWHDSGGYMVLAASLDPVDASARGLLRIGFGMLVVTLVVLGAVAAWVVRIGLRPLTRMEHAAAEIAAGNLSRRVPDADPHTEPGRLGVALNVMLDRIEAEVRARVASERRLREFLADASHELRTPLTSIRGFAELYRRGGAEPGPGLDEAMARIEDEAARMGLLVNDLLLLARLDEERSVERRPVDLLAVAADTVRDARARAPDRFVALGAVCPPDGPVEPVTVPGDEPRLRQVAANLLANALRYTPPEADVVVRVGPARAGAVPDAAYPLAAAVGPALPPGARVAVLEVCDTGPGVPLADATRVFERQYRVGPRSRGGAGLGLSIVAAIVVAHGGRVELATVPGRGAAFRVLLPVSPVADFEPAPS